MTLERILRGRPQTDREDARYIAEMVECLSWLTPEEHAWVTDPREGVQTRTKYLPTPGDVFDVIRERRERRERTTASSPRGVFRFDDRPDPRPPADVRRKQVIAALGYDALARRMATVRTGEDDV